MGGPQYPRTDAGPLSRACGSALASFGSPQGPLAQKRKLVEKQVQKKARVASHKFVLRVDRLVEVIGDKGLELFQNVCELDKLGLLQGARTGKDFPQVMPQVPEDLTVQSLAICSDQEQVQVTGAEFILAPEPHGLACTGVRFSDEFHRSHNDLSMAISRSGFAPIVQAGTLIFNIGYGPWQSHSFFHQLVSEAARMAATLSADSQLALRFWPRRRMDPGFDGDQPDQAHARRSWLQGLGSDMDIIGVKVAPSKWMSFLDAGEAWSKKLGSRALILAALCMEKGWVLSAEDLFGGTRLFKVADGVTALPKSKAEAVKSAKAKLDGLKARTQNTVVTATRLVCDSDVVTGLRLVLHATAPLHAAFADLVREFTSPEKCLEVALGWARQTWLRDLERTDACLLETTGLARCGFIVNMTPAFRLGEKPAEGALQYQDALGSRLGTLVDWLVATRSGSLSLKAFYYPGKLARLLSTDAAEVAACMGDFEKDVRAFWAAQDTDDDVAS